MLGSVDPEDRAISATTKAWPRVSTQQTSGQCGRCRYQGTEGAAWEWGEGDCFYPLQAIPGPPWLSPIILSKQTINSKGHGELPWLSSG